MLHPRKSDGPPISAILVQQTKDKIVLEIDTGKHTDIITLTPEAGSFRRGNAAPAVLQMTMPESVEPGCNF